MDESFWGMVDVSLWCYKMALFNILPIMLYGIIGKMSLQFLYIYINDVIIYIDFFLKIFLFKVY